MWKAGRSHRGLSPWKQCGGDRSVCVCALLIPLFTPSLSSSLPQVGTTSARQDQPRCQGKNRMGHRWWRHAGDSQGGDGLMVRLARVPACFSTELPWPPLFHHYSQFTTKHPHRSVRSYLWGDSKMSMGFPSRRTDSKTFNGTFKTTNGF